MTAYIVDRAPKLEGFPLTIYMWWQLTMALTRIIINHGAMPDGINGLAQVNEAAELYRGPKTFPAQTFYFFSTLTDVTFCLLFFLQPLRARFSTSLFLYRVK